LCRGTGVKFKAASNMMMFSERRIAFHVAQGVVHPAHVPLQTEAQTARVGGPRNLRPGGGFLGNGLHIRVLAINRFLEAAQRIHGFQVFASAILVGNPFARFARVVQAKHGSHAIDAQPVHVILLQPKEGAAKVNLAPQWLMTSRTPLRKANHANCVNSSSGLLV
jgi:hypothetical protein